MFQDFDLRNVFFQKKNVIGFILVLGTSVFFLVAERSNAMLAVKSKFFNFVSAVGRPVFSFAAKISDAREGILRYREITDENRALRVQERVDLEKLVLFEETAKENQALRDALGLKKEFGRAVIPAHIAGLFRDVSEEIIIVDKGAEDGITVGAVVIGKNHVLVGRVIEAYEKTAQVILATSPSEKIDVVFAGTALRASAQGDGAGEFALGLVPYGAQVAEGDTVLVSHADSAYPYGFIAGTVSRIRESEARVFRDLRARSLFDPFRDEEVYILR